MQDYDLRFFRAHPFMNSPTDGKYVADSADGRYLANALAAHDYLERSIRRHQQYASLAPPLQVALAQSWQRHRDRFGIARGTTGSTTRREHAELLPSGHRVRDAAFLDEQLRVIAGAIEESA